MQLGILSVLLGVPNGAIGQGQSGGAQTGIFSQLLGDLGAGDSQQGTGGGLLGDVAPGALAAQEVDMTASDQASIDDLLNQEISADDATDMLTQLDQLAADAESDVPLVAQLKETLTVIKDSKTPQTLGAVIAKLPALHAPERGPVAERLLGWMKDNLKKEQSPQDVAMDDSADDAAQSPVVQSLQASIFRDADTATAEKKEETTTDYVEIIPLAQQASQAPAWVKNLTKTPVRADLDTAVPALKASNDNELPEVNLPSLKEAKADKAATFADALRPLPDAGTQAAPTQPVAAPVAAHAPAAHSGVISIGNQHGLNHAPVAEQVHVAISRGKKDGIDEMTIQLDPADLGRVEVRMHTNSEGHTQISFLVDKAETMDSLARDARSLERALQESGVKADAGNMQFNLRQQAQQQAQGDGSGQRRPQWDDEAEGAVGPQAAAAVGVKNYTLTLRDGVDIRA